MWQRLAAQEEAGRLALRLRTPFPAMHAKLYLWQTAERAHWACSWFQTHWQAPPSRRAPQVWAELGADGLPEITVEPPRAIWRV